MNSFSEFFPDAHIPNVNIPTIRLYHTRPSLLRATSDIPNNYISYDGVLNEFHAHVFLLAGTEQYVLPPNHTTHNNATPFLIHFYQSTHVVLLPPKGKLTIGGSTDASVTANFVVPLEYVPDRTRVYRGLTLFTLSLLHVPLQGYRAIVLENRTHHFAQFRFYKIRDVVTYVHRPAPVVTIHHGREQQEHPPSASRQRQ